MKKTLIICITLILLATAMLITVIIIKNNDSSVTEKDKVYSKTDKSSLTFEQFTKGMKKDLSKEVMDEVRILYDQYLNTETEEEAAKIFDKLYRMGVYEGKDDYDIDKKKENDKKSKKESGK